jgi:hypothetical protein
MRPTALLLLLCLSSLSGQLLPGYLNEAPQPTTIPRLLSSGFGADSSANSPARFLARFSVDSAAVPGCGKDGCLVMHYLPTYHWELRWRVSLGLPHGSDTLWFGPFLSSPTTGGYWEVDPDPRHK